MEIPVVSIGMFDMNGARDEIPQLRPCSRQKSWRRLSGLLWVLCKPMNFPWILSGIRTYSGNLWYTFLPKRSKAAMFRCPNLAMIQGNPG